MAPDDKFPYFVSTYVIEWDLITMGEITVSKKLIPRLNDICLPNSNANHDNMPLQWRSKSSKDRHVLTAGIKMGYSRSWKFLQEIENKIIFKQLFV